jgi:hypothetical protein
MIDHMCRARTRGISRTQGVQTYRPPSKAASQDDSHVPTLRLKAQKAQAKATSRVAGKNAQGGHGLIDEAEVVQSFCLLGHSATSISTPSGPCTLRWRAQGLLYVFDSVAIPLPISVVLMRVIDSLYPNRACKQAWFALLILLSGWRACAVGFVMAGLIASRGRQSQVPGAHGHMPGISCRAVGSHWVFPLRTNEKVRTQMSPHPL